VKTLSLIFIASALLVTSFISLANASFSFVETAQDDANKVVVFVSDAAALSGQALQLNQQSDGRFAALLELNEFTPSSQGILHLQMVGEVDDVLVIGIDSDKALDGPALQNLGGKIAASLSSTSKDVEASVFVDGLSSDSSITAAHLAYGYHLRHYSFDKYQSKKQDGESNITFVTPSANENENLYANDLKFIAQGVHLARDLASEPGKSMYPQLFVDTVSALFKGVDNVKIDVLDVKDMEKYNMGALMGVGKGSIHEPRMLVIEYTGGKRGDAPIALAGKGITFDTGGISIKPNTNMWMMKADLSGAAAVAGTMHALAQRGENVNVIGLMPLAENMPAEDAIRPGDVLQTMQGTTIEIISTDAEGRLILADAVYYAQDKYKPKMLLNIATLTGSAARALGDEYAALVTRNMPYSLQMMEVGEKSGEHVWPLPLHENHFEQIKSDIADIKNSGAGNPGASIGAAVIGTFVADDLPWVHLDIAGVDWLSSSIDVAPKGSQGWGVRYMDQLVRDNK
jgi:leucyl aminopeptidase